jgi:hypothetical protein
MKLLALLVVLFACGKTDDAVDHWPEVERMATPAIPGGDGAVFDRALAKLTYDGVPDDAIEDAIAWRKAGGGLSSRIGPRAQLDTRPFELGEALIARDPATALYLAYRLHEESPNLMGVAMGFALTQRVLDNRAAWQPEYAAWAPAEAEIRRGIAAEAVMVLESIPPNDRPKFTRWWSQLLVGAPRERAAFLAHVDRMIAKAKGTDLEVLLEPKLRQRIEDMYKTIDAYRAWQGT